MKLQHVILAALSATALYALASDSVGKLPEPWFLSGDAPKSYQAGVDFGNTTSGKGAKFIRYVSGGEKSWASLMQSVSANHYAGKRVRFQAKVKAQNVSDWAGLWMRVDTANKNAVALYNSHDKPIKGSLDWQSRVVVLDVPADASGISFGVINSGTGEVWIDDLKLEIVGNDVPVSRQSGKLAEEPKL